MDISGRPIRLFITAGQVSDYTGAAALINDLPEADWFREALVDMGTKPRILGKSHARKPSSTPFETLL